MFGVWSPAGGSLFENLEPASLLINISFYIDYFHLVRSSKAESMARRHDRLTVVSTDMAVGEPSADSFGQMPLVEMGAAAEEKVDHTKADREVEGKSLRYLLNASSDCLDYRIFNGSQLFYKL